MGKLDNKIALVTGSSSGIGKTVALAFAEQGADLVLNYPDDSQLQNVTRVQEEIAATGRRVTAVRADVSQEEQVQSLIDTSVETYGRIDILVNNAGIGTASLVEQMSVAMWDEMLAVNLRSVFLCTRLVLPLMYRQNSGKIISTASQLAYKGAPGLSHYCAAKARHHRLHPLPVARNRHAQYQRQLCGAGGHSHPARRGSQKRGD